MYPFSRWNVVYISTVSAAQTPASSVACDNPRPRFLDAATALTGSQRRAPAARTALRAAALAAVRPPLAPPKLKMR